MSKYFLLPCLLLVAGTLSAARAQISDTIEQCDQRLGPAVPPTDQTSEVRFYKEAGVTIQVLFVEGKAAVVTFSKAGGGLTDEEQQKCLKKNVGVSAWEEVPGAGPRTWARADGEVFGFYDTAKGELTVMTAAYLQKMGAEAEQAK